MLCPSQPFSPTALEILFQGISRPEWEARHTISMYYPDRKCTPFMIQTAVLTLTKLWRHSQIHRGEKKVQRWLADEPRSIMFGDEAVVPSACSCLYTAATHEHHMTTITSQAGPRGGKNDLWHNAWLCCLDKILEDAAASSHVCVCVFYLCHSWTDLD